jgi:class 3 adenylate cyclase
VPPLTRYTHGDGVVSVAYQVVGDGPRDLVFSPGFVSHVEWMWEEPAVAYFLERLASCARLILFDKRGTGLSDPVSRPPTLEERADDIRLVMDAAGSEQAAILGVSEGAATAILVAASDPGRVSALLLYGGYARLLHDEDYPEGFEPGEFSAFLDRIMEQWGEPSSLALWSPQSADRALQEWWGRLLRLGASPGMARLLLDSYVGIDIREALPALRVQTLVVRRRDDSQVPARFGRYLAEHISGASYVDLEGDEHLYFLGDSDALADELEEFLTGSRSALIPNRRLATVLFVDIVGSTQTAAQLGDRRWTQLLRSAYTTARRQIDRFRGDEVKTTGDGLVATFDGPARAALAAMAIREAFGRLGLEIRAGLHTGEIEVLRDDIAGICVHIGSRIATEARPGEILASATVRDLVAGSELRFADRGARTLEGVHGEWALFAVEDT